MSGNRAVSSQAPLSTGVNSISRGVDAAALPGPAAVQNQLALETPLVLGLLVVSTFVVVLNETLMNVALATLMSALDITAATAQWLTTSYLLTMAIVIPTSGFLLQRFTTRQVFITAMSLFSAGTLVAGLANGFGALLTGRIVQASGAAVMMPLLMTAMLSTVPPKRRGSMMGLVFIVVAVAPALGPSISGAILSRLNWHFLFWTVLPIALTSLVVGVFKLRNVTPTHKVSLDVLSVALSALAFGGIVFGLASIGEATIGAAILPPWIPLTVGAVGLGVFILRQRRLARLGRALLNLRTFANPSFRVAIIVIALLAMTVLGTLTVIPLYLQNVLDTTPLTTGLLLLPGGLLMGLLSPFAGRLYDRVGPGPLVIPGAVAYAAAQVLFATTLTTTSPVWLPMAIFTLMHVALAFLFTPLVTSALGPLSKDLYSHGSATFSAVQKLAGAAGVAIFVALMTIGTNNGTEAAESKASAVAEGVHTAFLGGATLAVLAVVGAVVLSRVAASIGKSQ